MEWPVHACLALARSELRRTSWLATSLFHPQHFAQQRIFIDIGTAIWPTMATGVDARLLKSTKFPAEFSQKVDMQKVNLQVMKKSEPPPIRPFLADSSVQVDRQQDI